MKEMTIKNEQGFMNVQLHVQLDNFTKSWASWWPWEMEQTDLEQRDRSYHVSVHW